MWPFKKRDMPTAPPPCNHKWQDFPWYMDTFFDDGDGTLDIEIIEPYVCVHCLERKNVVLFKESWSEMKPREIDDTIKHYKQLYADHLQPHAIVEDQIHDMQMVDREYLDILYKLRAPRMEDLT